MANYSQKFTLADIFNNKKLRNKLPLVNYREIEREDGKISRRTSAKTVNRFVFDTATSAARPFYKPILTHRSGDSMIISGTLVGDHNACVDAVYERLVAQKPLFTLTANNMDMIRDALKESEKTKASYGLPSKLYLRANSMQEIEGMSRPQLLALMVNVMENIFYSDNFPTTQKKWGVADIPTNDKRSYKERKEIWQNRVGE